MEDLWSKVSLLHENVVKAESAVERVEERMVETLKKLGESAKRHAAEANQRLDEISEKIASAGRNRSATESRASLMAEALRIPMCVGVKIDADEFFGGKRLPDPAETIVRLRRVCDERVARALKSKTVKARAEFAARKAKARKTAIEARKSFEDVIRSSDRRELESIAEAKGCRWLTQAMADIPAVPSVVSPDPVPRGVAQSASKLTPEDREKFVKRLLEQRRESKSRRMMEPGHRYIPGAEIIEGPLTGRSVADSPRPPQPQAAPPPEPVPVPAPPATETKSIVGERHPKPNIEEAFCSTTGTEASQVQGPEQSRRERVQAKRRLAVTQRLQLEKRLADIESEIRQLLEEKTTIRLKLNRLPRRFFEGSLRSTALSQHAPSISYSKAPKELRMEDLPAVEEVEQPVPVPVPKTEGQSVSSDPPKTGSPPRVPPPGHKLPPRIPLSEKAFRPSYESDPVPGSQAALSSSWRPPIIAPRSQVESSSPRTKRPNVQRFCAAQAPDPELRASEARERAARRARARKKELEKERATRSEEMRRRQEAKWVERDQKIQQFLQRVTDDMSKEPESEPEPEPEPPLPTPEERPEERTPKKPDQEILDQIERELLKSVAHQQGR